MRFKFRAWDIEKQVMMPLKFMDWSDWWVSCDSTYGQAEPWEFGERNSFNNDRTDRHILMPYTGLQDENGKEIYEGDVVEAEGMFPSTVVFENGTFRFDGGSPSIVDDWGYYSNFVVIGNIYENPELVE